MQQHHCVTSKTISAVTWDKNRKRGGEFQYDRPDWTVTVWKHEKQQDQTYKSRQQSELLVMCVVSLVVVRAVFHFIFHFNPLWGCEFQAVRAALRKKTNYEIKKEIKQDISAAITDKIRILIVVAALDIWGNSKY